MDHAVDYPIITVMGCNVLLLGGRIDSLRELPELLCRLRAVLRQKVLSELSCRMPFLSKDGADEHDCSSCKREEYASQHGGSCQASSSKAPRTIRWFVRIIVWSRAHVLLCFCQRQASIVQKMAGPPPQPPKVVYKPKAKPGSLPPRRRTSKLVISGAIVGFLVLFFALLDQVKVRNYFARLHESSTSFKTDPFFSL